MTLYRKKPIAVHAHQWFKNGDHPLDCATENLQVVREGAIVRYYRHPRVSGNLRCAKCNNTMHVHGWIDTLEGGHIVCPGDWIITGIKGEHYPCKPDIFAATYEPVEDDGFTKFKNEMQQSCVLVPKEQLDLAKARCENLQVVVDEYHKHLERAQSTLNGSGLGKNILEAALDEIDALRKRAEAAEELLKPVKYSYSGISVIGDQYDWYKRRNAHLKEYVS